MNTRTWWKRAAVWLLLAVSMALGTAVTELVIRWTGIWPPPLRESMVESNNDSSMHQEAPFTSCFVAASRHR